MSFRRKLQAHIGELLVIDGPVNYLIPSEKIEQAGHRRPIILVDILPDFQKLFSTTEHTSQFHPDRIWGQTNNPNPRGVTRAEVIFIQAMVGGQLQYLAFFEMQAELLNV